MYGARVRRDAAAPGWLVLETTDGSALLLSEAEAAGAVAALLQAPGVREALRAQGEGIQELYGARTGVVVATVRLQ